MTTVVTEEQKHNDHRYCSVPHELDDPPEHPARSTRQQGRPPARRAPGSAASTPGSRPRRSRRTGRPSRGCGCCRPPRPPRPPAGSSRLRGSKPPGQKPCRAGQAPRGRSPACHAPPSHAGAARQRPPGRALTRHAGAAPTGRAVRLAARRLPAGWTNAVGEISRANAPEWHQRPRCVTSRAVTNNLHTASSPVHILQTHVPAQSGPSKCHKRTARGAHRSWAASGT